MASETYTAMAKNLNKDTDLKVLWPLYKEAHKRNYDAEEDIKRFEHFVKKVADVVEHNAKYERGEVTFTMGLNQFTDMFEHEVNKYTHGVRN